MFDVIGELKLLAYCMTTEQEFFPVLTCGYQFVS